MGKLLELLPEAILFGSVIYFYLLLGLFVFILFASDIKRNGYFAFVSFVIFVLVTYFWSSFNVFSYLTIGYIGIYLGVGFIYSLIRTFFYGRNIVYTGYRDNPDENDPDWRKKEIEKKKSYLKGNVFRWWFLFPVSLLNWIFTDLVKDLYNYLYSKVSKVYEMLFDLGVKDKR